MGSRYVTNSTTHTKPEFFVQVQANIFGELKSDDVYLKMISGKSDEDGHSGDNEVLADDTEREYILLANTADSQSYISGPTKKLKGSPTPTSSSPGDMDIDKN